MAKNIKISKEVWAPQIIQACHFYALEEDAKVLNIMGSTNGVLSIQCMMQDKLTNAIIREKVISAETGLDHNINMLSTTNGVTKYDASRKVTGKHHEIKSEQHSTFTGRSGTQLTGGGAFGFESKESIISLRDNDPIISYGAFYDGRLLVIAEVLLSETEIINALNGYIERQELGKKTTCKFLKSDWINAKNIYVPFMNPDWPSDANRNLRSFLKERFQTQTQLNTSLPNLDSLSYSKNNPMQQTPSPYMEEIVLP